VYYFSLCASPEKERESFSSTSVIPRWRIIIAHFFPLFTAGLFPFLIVAELNPRIFKKNKRRLFNLEIWRFLRNVKIKYTAASRVLSLGGVFFLRVLYNK